jgi:ZIP family zinc transporter
LLRDALESLESIIAEASGGDPVKAAFLISLYAAAMTSLGGALVIVVALRSRGGSSGGEGLEMLLDVGMGFSSGVMIAASFTSLLLPALELSGPSVVFPSFILGAIAIHVINAILPHEHLIKGYEGPPSFKRKLRAAWLVATAIILHNLPEGMAIGAATSYSLGEGIGVGLAIGTQDFPEGLAVALPIYASNGSLGLALLVAVISGLSEVVLALSTAAVIGFYGSLLASSLAFAAGAMIYVVSHEALPESHRTGHEKQATLGFFLGFIIMLYLDTQLG